MDLGKDSEELSKLLNLFAKNRDKWYDVNWNIFSNFFGRDEISHAILLYQSHIYPAMYCKSLISKGITW